MKNNSANKKRVLFVLDSLGSGGAEKDLVTVINLLDKNKYNVELLTFSKGGLYENLVPESVKRLEIPLYYQFLSKKYNSINFFFRLIFLFLRTYSAIFTRVYSWYTKFFSLPKLHPAQLNWKFNKFAFSRLKSKYDAAIAFSQGLPTYFVATNIIAISKYAWINTDYNEAKYNIHFDSIYYNQFNKVINISPRGEEIFLEAHPKLKQKSLIVYNIISGDVIKKMSQSGNGFIDDFNGIRILTIGRIVPPKGYDLAIKACANLKEKNINFKWYAIGEGPMKPELETLIKEKNVDDVFSFIGTYSNPYPFINQCDIYCQPSRFEGFGIALAEARILNKPIVATNFEVVYNQLTNKINGIITPMNPNALAEGIELLIQDSNLKKSVITQLKTESASNESEIKKIEAIIDL